MNVTNNTIF